MSLFSAGYNHFLYALFDIFYFSLSSLNGDSHLVDNITADQTSVIVTDLQPYTRYQAQLQVVNGVGSSDWGPTSDFVYTEQAGETICL